MTQIGHIFTYMSLLDQSGVTGGGLDPYKVHALFVNVDNMWMERFAKLRLSCFLRDDFRVLVNLTILGVLMLIHVFFIFSQFL